MKLTLSKLDFVKSLSFIQDIVQTKSTIPILANVLLEAKQGRLHLSGTDMDMTISDKIKIKNIETEGATCVPVHILYNVIKELSDDKLILQLNEAGIEVTNKDDADDLLQDVLIKFHQNISTLNDPKRLKAWLFQITNNTIVDYYRRLGKDQKLETETLWYEIPEKSIQMELAQCIIPFLSQLPEDKATIIQAIDLAGESQKAYAQRNNISY